jgi:hypothetical protein
VTGDWKKLDHEELHSLYSSPDIINWHDQIKKNEMGNSCSAHGEMRNTKFWLENLKGRHHSDDLGADGRIILKWILWT